MCVLRNNGLRMRRWGVFVMGGIVLADQLSKALVLAQLEIRNGAPLAYAPFANLVAVWNRGISFGVLSHHPHDLALAWVGLAGLICAWLLRWLWHAPSYRVAIALGLIIGGAVGNVIDRLRFGAVFDFLDFHAFGYHWPAFNIADSAIVIGVLLLMLDSLCTRSDPT